MHLLMRISTFQPELVLIHNLAGLELGSWIPMVSQGYTKLTGWKLTSSNNWNDRKYSKTSK